jgi:anti-sigma B factor antagonist
MSSPSAKMLVSVGEQFACLKVSGRANFTTSVDFKTLLNELLRKGYNYLILDLAECILMDSTFLGVLAGFGLKVTNPPPGQPHGTIELFNANPRIAELLESLGVLHLFKMTQGNINMPENCQSQEPAPAGTDREEVTRTCLEAHQTLMQINPDNVSRFKDVAAFLADDLKKLKTKT